MTKTVAIFEQSLVDADQAIFHILDEESGNPLRTLILSHEDWYSLGCPVELTVTVELGDKLNGEQP